MSEQIRPGEDDREPAARHLILVFLASVAVCAVFFSLGFLVGYNEKTSRPAPVAENVSAPAVIPPTVNPPPESSSSASGISEAGPADEANSSQDTTVRSPRPLPSLHPKAEKPARATPPATKTHVLQATTSSAPALDEHSSGHTGTGFSVQVIASRTRADAESLARILEGRGYPAFVLSPQAINATDNLFRVLVGPYSNRAQADRVRSKLEKEGFRPFIKH